MPVRLTFLLILIALILTHSASTSQVVHVNLFGLYQNKDFDVDVDVDANGINNHTTTPKSLKMEHQQQQGLMSMPLWEQGHRRNYFIKEG